MQPLSVCQGRYPFTGGVGKPQRPDGGVPQEPAFAPVPYEIGKSHTDFHVVGVGVNDDVPQAIVDPAGIGVAGHARSSASRTSAGQENE
jgi:hypothetical protein